MYMLDTSIWIDILRGNLQPAFDIMRSCAPSQFKVPAIVVAELYYGAEHSAHPQENYRITERLIAPYEIIPFDARCARVYARINNELNSRGARIGHYDALIAATAIAHEAILVTNNYREFSRINGLRLESWYDISDIWAETGKAEVGE